MNLSRDPFSIRRTSPAASLLRTSAATLSNTAAQATQRAVGATETFLEKSRTALSETPYPNVPHAAGSMSTYGLPNGTSSQQPEITGRARFHYNDAERGEGIGEKVTNMFAGQGKNELPMYKDKPYNYSGKRRLPPWARNKKILGPVLAVFALLSWWFGILSPLSWLSSSGKSGSSSSAIETTSSKSSSWFGSKEVIDWNERADRVKDAFKISWDGYVKYGWGYDEYHPVSHGGKQMTPNGLGWIIVDALDTMMLMNMTTELTHARQWIQHNLTYDQDHDVNTFETTIRMMGGLLSAHYLSVGFPGKFAPVEDDFSDDLYVERATDLADRLLGAYETKTGIPLASVNLHTYKGIPSHADGGASSTAEATTLQLEMKYLSKLTGEQHYWQKAEHVMKAVDDIPSKDGLVPIFIYADLGSFRGNNIRLGSRGDSYYEYLIKQYLQTSQEEPVYQAMWNESLAGVKKHLLTYSSPNNYTVLAERPNGLRGELDPKMDHLACFMPGTIALATTGGLPLSQMQKRPNWGEQQEEDIQLARELTKTCMGMYRTETGLAPEIAHFNIHDPPLMYEDFSAKQKPKSPESFTKCKNSACNDVEEVSHEDFVFKLQDNHNLQRPETVESLFYMWRITGDEIYRQWGWEMFQAFVKWTAVPDGEGFSSIHDVKKTPPRLRDNMESFWMAETLKYFYLLFSDNDLLPLQDVVFNTEAHPFPRFQMGKLFKTGWERKAARDAQAEAQPDTSDGRFKIQTIEVTKTVAPVAEATAEAAELAEAAVGAIDLTT